MKRNLYRIIGVTFWIAILVTVYATTRGSFRSADAPVQSTLVRYLRGATSLHVANDVSNRLRPLDPIFLRLGNESWMQAGHIAGIEPGEDSAVSLRWYGEQPLQHYRLVQYHTRGDLTEVVATLLPAAKRHRIQQRLTDLMQQHGDQMVASLTPLVEESIRRSLPVIEAEFRASVQRNRAELDAIADRWNEEIVQERMIPLARREILPIVRKNAQPTVEKIGRELWDRASLWRFGWRVAYDRLPLTERRLASQEWDRFVEEEAVPVFEAHVDEIVLMLQKTVADISGNEAVRNEFYEVASEVAMDPAMRQLVRELLKESIVENEELRELWREIWRSPRAKAAMDVATDRLEPVIRGIGDDLFGSRETGIDPDFARVLRNQILGKDRRWVVAVPIHPPRDDGSVPVIEVADQLMSYPLIYVADSAQAATQ